MSAKTANSAAAESRSEHRKAPVRLFFLIRSLGYGGAERQLIELVKGLDTRRFDITVATFYDGGGLRPEIEKIKGIKVLSLGKKGRWDVLPFVWRLWRAVRAAKPEIIHGYMGTANELALLMGRLVGAHVVWGVRMSNRDSSKYDWLSAFFCKSGAALARFADLAIVNSHAGKRDHVAKGYCDKRMIVIHNGIDTERFYRSPEAGRMLRQEWGISDGERLIGIVGRLDPQKDHQTFLRAAALLAQRRPDVRFVCVGDGRADYKEELKELEHELGLDCKLRWVPASKNVLAVYNALDIATSSSLCGEGFGNVIGEAMACEVPVIVTDTGDSAIIVGNAEQVVPAQNPEKLASAWDRMLNQSAEQRTFTGQAQRARITNEFSLRHLVNRTVCALESLQ